MAWDYTAAEALSVPTTTSENVDRIICKKVTIDLANKRLICDMVRGVSDGSPGGVVTSERAIAPYVVTSGATFDALMASLNLESVLFAQAQTDGAIPAGSVS